MNAGTPAGAPAAASPPQVSLVVPAFNEAGCLEQNVTHMLEFCRHEGIRADVLIVDDGSTDATRRIAERLAREDARIHALANPTNMGKGAAVRRGMRAATGAVVLFLDADLSTPMNALPHALAAIENGADVVIGSRRVPGAQISQHQPWLRETLGRGFTAITRFWLGVPVADFTCGFKAFRADCVLPIFERQRLNDWSFDAELCFLATRLGFRLEQVPVVWTDDADSKVRVGGAIVSSLLGLWRIRWRALIGAYDRP